ncbi:hypothetical protein [Endozoicomonas sp. ALB091]|uniref:hypothetical protein n=1 Tax=Endozoicomonas sp. ALB091 TaxID=3403073 RepID=UPI003BB52137
MNVNPGAGTNANANGVNNTSEFADIVVTGVTTLSFFLGYGVSTYAGDNYLNRACLAGVVGATGYLLAESVHHGVAALWNSAVAVHDSVTTLMTNLPITPFNEESHIVKASTYAGAYLGLRYSPLRQRPARNLVDPSAPPDPYIDNTFYAARVLMAGTSSAMLGGGVGYLLGKGLDLTAKAAISGAKMAADRLGLKPL